MQRSALSLSAVEVEMVRGPRSAEVHQPRNGDAAEAAAVGAGTSSTTTMNSPEHAA